MIGSYYFAEIDMITTDDDLLRTHACSLAVEMYSKQIIMILA